MLTEDEEITVATECMERAKITDWLKRANGEYTRVLQFTAPITDATLRHICVAIFLMDGPGGQAVMPGENVDELSSDRRLLRLRVVPRATPRLHDQQFTPTDMFGRSPAMLAS